MAEFDSKAYSEVYEIINMLSAEEKTKIPEKWHELIETKRDKEYKFDARDEDIKLLEDTEKILSVLYTDYLATEDERKIIQAKEKGTSINKMGSSNIAKSLNNTEYEVNIAENNKLEMIEYQKTFFERCIEQMKNFFKFNSKKNKRA